MENLIKLKFVNNEYEYHSFARKGGRGVKSANTAESVTSTECMTSTTLKVSCTTSHFSKTQLKRNAKNSQSISIVFSLSSRHDKTPYSRNKYDNPHPISSQVAYMKVQSPVDIFINSTTQVRKTDQITVESQELI